MTSTSSKRQHLVHATGKASAAAGYDALLKDDVYWPASVLSEVLNLTVVDVLSMGPAQPLLGQPWSHPNPVAYLPQLGSGLTPNMVSSSKLHANLAAKCNADSDLNKLTSLLVINITSQWSRADITECHSGAKCTSSMGSASVMPKVLTLSCLVHVLQQHFLSPELTLSAMQGFLQRCQNYLSKAVLKQVIMRLARNNQQQFMQESGLRVRAYEQGFSTSAAAIIAADWALEYPHLTPPKAHASLYHSAHMHHVTSHCRVCEMYVRISNSSRSATCRLTFISGV